MWETDLDWLKARFDPTPVIGDGQDGKEILPMNYKGIPVSRWIDGVNEDKDNIGQRDNVRAMVLWGHAVNSQTRGHEMKKAMEKLDLIVIVDPYPTHAAVMNDRKEGTYLLPASTQFETYGSVTASNRSIQWRDKIIDPVWESLARPHHHGEVRAQARLCGRAVQEHPRQRDRPTSRTSRTSPARSTGGCGRSATPARAPSA